MKHVDLTTAAFGILIGSVLTLPGTAIGQDRGPWPQWRGPEGNNHAGANAQAPGQWDLKTGENIAWKTKLPGRGHSTPIVTPQGIFLTTADADAETQSVLKIDPAGGRLLNEWVIHRGTLPQRIHPNNSYASPSMAFDGERLFAAFHTDDAIVLTALSVDGAQQWQRRVADFRPARFQFGYGASPIIDGDVVIVAAEYDGPDSGIYALDRTTGKQVWKIERPENLNFASPIVTTIAGKRQLLIAGADQFSSYDPETGKPLWTVPTTTEAICGTAVWDDRRVLVSGGNPEAGTWCVTADGREQLLWQNRVMCYEQSLLAIPNHVIGVADNGVAYCWRTQDGKATWQERLFGGGISASPLLVDDRVIVASERGEVFVLASAPSRFEKFAQIQTGDSIFATPIVIGNRLYIRTGINENGGRQEYLVAIGS
ncbi:PQQ-binding-like beta-propeller repeat protein [Roseiconus nitratireducens]|uniref:PQQ-binding-like beta-propeller repeat protein n=1 Tax=Roseiconus nitratireducens TaxID=2605748 RepID=A0A5M6CW92_9BACT|nr:PQQ-binding-like beta-propeller repeat protein [Roseiconus nitratireducens]KAA5539494.1 PQQ-binding-like beta-propeller repeat protein [Roseiconus nitratireducens]